MKDRTSDDFRRLTAQLNAPIGDTGSGGTRYAAAMALYQLGLMEVDLLEIYRRCCRLDHEDPIDLARFEGIDPLRSEALKP